MLRPMAQGYRALLVNLQRRLIMKIDLETILKELGLPLALVALFSAILGLFGVSLDNILKIVEGLVGTFALIALLINVLKWAGVVNDGTAGKWSAALNLVVLITVTVVFKLYPSFDFGSLDAQIAEFAKVAGIVFAYIIQLVGSKGVHTAMVRGLRITAFSHSMQARKLLGRSLVTE
jgi:hypothetical protein